MSEAKERMEKLALRLRTKREKGDISAYEYESRSEPVRIALAALRERDRLRAQVTAGVRLEARLRVHFERNCPNIITANDQEALAAWDAAKNEMDGEHPDHPEGQPEFVVPE